MSDQVSLQCLEQKFGVGVSLGTIYLHVKYAPLIVTHLLSARSLVSTVK
jgi:hypothetical protein